MIAPEPGEGINRQTSWQTLLRNNLLVSMLIFACLQVWRPYFFLTDDNLTGGFPLFTEIGNHLLHGQSPFVSDYLFGGNYDLLRDPTFFGWHPVYLLVSLLAGTPFRLAMVDVDAFIMIMLATAGFVILAHYLRREMSLKLTDGWLMFYCMSFSYSMIVMTTGASWMAFLGNQSAMPWLALGILQKTWRRGIGLVTLFSLHHILGGHLAPLVSSSIFFSFFAGGISLYQKSTRPLAVWLGGYALAVLILLPLLVPLIHGFYASSRSQGVILEDMQANNIPALFFPTSLFCGMALWIFHPGELPHTTYILALGSCAAAWCLIPALVSRAKWRGLEMVCLGLMVFVAILIIRPLWITKLMVHLPLFKSMRWPFRELLQFQFFLHLFLLIRPPGLTIRTQRRIAVFSATVLVVPLFLFVYPPTFNHMQLDRKLLLTGELDSYWNRVRPLLKPTDRVAVLIPWKLYEDDRFQKPYSLLASFNYSALARVTNAAGYSPTVPKDQRYTKTNPGYYFGAYTPEQRSALLEERPDLKFLTLESLEPMKITLSSRDEPAIDLTPYLPTQKTAP